MVRKLVLHAATPGHAPPDPERLAHVLGTLGLVADRLPGHDQAWYAGEQFLSLVIFLGCSPQVAFRPASEGGEGEDRYCHVRYRETGGEPVFQAGPGPLRVRCPACRQPLTDTGQVTGVIDRETRLACPACGRRHSPMDLDWRQGAGCGRWFLEIWNVHPHEAVPAEALIMALEQLAGTPVRFFYE